MKQTIGSGFLGACIMALAFHAASVVAAEAAAGEEAKAEQTFAIWEYRILGNSRLQTADIERALYDRLGENKRIADVEAARAALEQLYRDRGYGTVFVDIPEQEVEGGIVRLHVTEGRLDRVHIVGARYFSNRMIRERLPEAAPNTTPNFQTLQAQIAEVNHLTGDRAVVPVLRAGRAPGLVDLELKVDDHLPVHGSLEVNDRYTADTSPLRTTATLSYDNLWQRAHSFSVQYQTAPRDPSNVKVWAGTYTAKFEDASPIWSLYAIDTNSNVATIGTLSVVGAGDIFGSRVTLPFGGSGNAFHNLSLGVDYKSFDNNVQVSRTQGVATTISYLNFAAQYGFNGYDSHGTTALSAGLNWGIRGLVGTDQEFNNSRFNAHANYVYLRASAARTQSLSPHLAAHVELEGQVSPTPLIANEQYSVGGASSVRGYLEAEALGDVGLRSSAELRFAPFATTKSEWRSAYAFVFFDWAGLRLHDPLPQQTSRYRLMSGGLGLEFTQIWGFNAGVDWAYPLRDAARTLRGDDRLDFYFRYGF